MRKRFERGDVPVGCIVGLAVLAIAALIGIKATPIMIHVGDLDREIGNMADRANRRDYKDPRIIRDILIKAEEVDLPVMKRDIKIQRSRTRFKVWVTYQIPVDFGFYTYTWNKEHFHDRPLF